MSEGKEEGKEEGKRSEGVGKKKERGEGEWVSKRKKVKKGTVGGAWGRGEFRGWNRGKRECEREGRDGG
jgi:hypothetical protein